MSQRKASTEAGPAVTDMYRVKFKGGVVIENRASGDRDGSLIPQGTIINPAMLADQADLGRLVANGMIERIKLTTERPTPITSTREPDPEVIPVLPAGSGSQTRYRVSGHPVVPNVIGSNDETPVTAGKTLPANLNPEWAELAAAQGLITAIQPRH